VSGTPDSADAAYKKMTENTPPAASAPAPEHVPAPAAPAQQTTWLTQRRLLGVAALGLCILIGLYLFVPDLIWASTDDAYVEAHISLISARVPGYVQTLHVDDNSRVDRGMVLLELDPSDYQARRDAAAANLAAAQSRLAEAHAQSTVAARAVQVAEADAETASANARLAEDDLKRFSGVSDVRAVSSQRLETAKTAEQTARATLSAARSRVELARAQAELTAAQEHTAEATVKQTQAALTQAELDLSYTHVVAPEDGSVANKLVELGNYVQPGQTLLSLVPRVVYVIANFKETQIDGIGAGDAASIRIDSFPELRLHGHIDSIQRGSGSEFALLPPENATGNFVKIVQRIPVKIVLDDPPKTLVRLAPGMSAEVSVRYSRRAGWLSSF
jgi:membrane fusion protein, multidrug efflux system